MRLRRESLKPCLRFEDLSLIVSCVDLGAPSDENHIYVRLVKPLVCLCFRYLSFSYLGVSLLDFKLRKCKWLFYFHSNEWSFNACISNKNNYE